MRILCLIVICVGPVLGADFSAYIGDANQYQVAALTTDAAGNTYVTGSRLIETPSVVTLSDVFVTKLDPNGNIVFTTTFGGKEVDTGKAIALDPTGNIWVGGSTSSENFPVVGAQANAGPGAGFLVKLAPDGTVIYSSYFDGVVNGIATDASGNLYITGSTNASDFPTTPGLPASMVDDYELTSISGAFVTKLDETASHVIYSAVIAGMDVNCSPGSTCFLSSRYTRGVSIAVDPEGEAVIAGNTNTLDLPVTPGGIAGYGAFAAKINAAGNQLAYLTYLGQSSGELTVYGPSEVITATAIAVDASGNAYLTGSTDDPNVPVTSGVVQQMLNANGAQMMTNAFAVKLNPSGSVVWGTFLGGSGSDVANSIRVDGAGDVWLAGNNGPGFPTGSRWTVIGGSGDFVVELNPTASAVSDELQFPQGAAGQALAIDPNGVLHIAGSSGLVSTVTLAQAPTPRIVGIMNAAAGPVSGRISPAEIISIFGVGLGPTAPVTAAPSNGFFPTSLGGVQVLVNGSAIPLLYVSSTQINAEIPSPLNGVTADNAQVQIINDSTTLPQFRVSVDPNIVGIFENGQGAASAINQDGTLNSPTNPAPAGTIVSIWVSGFSQFSGLNIDGAVLASASDWCTTCQIQVGTATQPVSYAGVAPGLIDGVMQINFVVPPQIGPTQVALYFENAPPATLYVTN